jgi:hypothetical protein
MKFMSRDEWPLKMNEPTPVGWTFLTSHAQVLVCIARDPGARLRDIADHIGITERAVHRIITDLADAGYIARRREGRRNRYTINTQFPLPDPVARERNVGELLWVLTGSRQSRRVNR